MSSERGVRSRQARNLEGFAFGQIFRFRPSSLRPHNSATLQQVRALSTAHKQASPISLPILTRSRPQYVFQQTTAKSPLRQLRRTEELSQDVLLNLSKSILQLKYPYRVNYTSLIFPHLKLKFSTSLHL